MCVCGGGGGGGVMVVHGACGVGEKPQREKMK